MSAPWKRGEESILMFFHKPSIARARKEMADEGHQGGYEVGQGDGKEE